MTDRIGRWPCSRPLGICEVIRHLIRGCRRKDGSIFMTRRQYIGWAWRSTWRKILFSPIRCLLGWHRIGEKSDTGIGCGCGPGLMDVWCLDCDRMLAVPIDEVIEMKKAARVLGLWREGRRQGLTEAKE